MSGNGRLLVAGSTCALALAAVILVAPELLPVSQSQLASALAGLTETTGLAGLAVIAGAIAAIQGLWSSRTPAAPPPLPVDGQIEPRETDERVAGTALDERLAAAGRVGGRAAESEAVVREECRSLATDVYQQVHGCDWETAARAVETGRWTSDPAAAAFVGGADAPDVPLRVWFRDVLSDEGAFYTQTARTLRAIETLRTTEPGGDPTAPDAEDATTEYVGLAVPEEGERP